MSRCCFLEHLRLEQRRTDRSRVPVSLMIFHPACAERGADVWTLADVLGRVRRETDVLGYLDDDTLGLLLTDTNAAGAHQFALKTAATVAALGFEVASGTYPDQVFDSVHAGESGAPDTLAYFLQGREHTSTERVLKRMLDVGGALALLGLFAPLMLLAALAVKLTSPGPVIFRQVRLGRNGRPFVFYKLRSMRRESDDRIHREYVGGLILGGHEQLNQGDSQRPLYKLRDDPRVTRVGRLLRKTSIDELPQLWNVLKGDMSLVGPRPPIPYEAERYKSWHLRRVLEARPGITGLWQVEGRSRVSFDDMVRLDLRYVRTWSPALDIRILLKTVGAVLRCDGEG